MQYRVQNGADTAFATHIGRVNPFRYRGYYYDEETNLYYLQSRYYDPTVCRFINADDVAYIAPETLNGLNLFAYCGNNPVMKVDPEGNMPNWLKIVLGVAVIVGLGILTALIGGPAGVILGASFWGATTGAIGGGLISGAIGALLGGAQGFFDGFADGFIWGAVIGGVSGALTSGINYLAGGVKIVGSAQKTGSIFHRFASNIQAGKMSMALTKYSEIHLNRSKGLGLPGFRPDVTGITKNGLKVVEVVSSTQTYASQVSKVVKMMKMFSHINSGMVLDGLHLILKWFIF